MTKELREIVELVSNNNNCVVFKVLPNSEMDLILLGCFGGDETLIRIANDNCRTITIFRKDGTHYSWGCNTLVVEEMNQMRRKIMGLIKG